jgi:2-desacetyl-2-hydroxyethyl bacteriochlorophyllide A dehydrogenase
MKVQEVTFHNTRDVELTSTDLTEKPLAPNQLLLATEYSVVSAGTELAIWRGVESWAQLPCVPGYGAVGVVQNVGSAVTRCAKGDRIFCYAGHRSLSIIDDSMVVRVPDDVPAHQAVVARMGQVALTSVRVSDVELGDTVVVLGLGQVGNLSAQLMKLSGCTVIGVDISEKRLATAKACGIEHVINPRDVNLVEAVRAINSGNLCNAVVEATGIPDSVATAVQLVQNGDVILLGTPRGEFKANATDMLREVHHAHRQVRMKGAHEWIVPKYPQPYLKHSLAGNIAQLFGFIKSGKLNIPNLISHRVPPTECRAVYNNLRDRNEDYFGVVFDWRAMM